MGAGGRRSATSSTGRSPTSVSGTCPGRGARRNWWRPPSSSATGSRPSSTAWWPVACWSTGSGSSRPGRPSHTLSPVATPTSTICSPHSSKCVGGSSPWVRSRCICREQRAPLLRRKVLHSLADGEAGSSAAAREQPCVDELGLLLAGLAERPADRLANEEFPFVEHPVRIAAESLEVAGAATQRWKQRQQRRTSHPEIRVRLPAIENGEQLWRAFDQGS